MVYTTACRVTQNAALAEDVVQEVFLALAHRSHESIRSVPAWLHRVTWVKARNAVRGESRRRQLEHEAALKAQDVEVCAWEQISPELDAALDELPEDLRTLIIEHFLERRGQAEIATRLGMNQSSVSRKVTQGVQALRERLRQRGLLVGAGLIALLDTPPAVALPARLSAELGKIALSGAGVGKISPLLIMTTKTKIAAMGVLALASVTLSYSWMKSSNTLEASDAKLVCPIKASAVSKASPSSETRSLEPSVAKLEDLLETPKSRMAKLQKLNASSFEKLMRDLVASGDVAMARKKLKELMGLDFTEEEIRQAMHDDKGFTMAVLKKLAGNHPVEALAWMSGLDQPRGFSFWITMSYLLESHPEINAAEMSSKLPTGKLRDLVLSILRAQTAPMAELNRALTVTPAGSAARFEYLRSIASHWPNQQRGEAAQWAVKHLQGQELQGFLGELLQQHAETSPDDTLEILRGINDTDALFLSLIRSMRGLVEKNGRVTDVLPLINSLQGDQRATAITELCGRWVRVDQKDILQWINQLESSADFDATLPLTLPQLTKANRTQALDTLMRQIDTPLEAALIKTVNPSLVGITESSTEIVHRLTQLPQHASIGSGRQGNQELLWQAVNQLAGDWVITHGGNPQKASQWIDSLRFNTPTDKAAVATQLYQQWKLRDPAAARTWATKAGVNIQ